MPGADLRRRLGLRSTWLSVGVLSLSAPTITVAYGSRARLTGTAAACQRRPSSSAPVEAGSRSVPSRPVRRRGQCGRQANGHDPVPPASGKVVAAAVRVPVAPLLRFYPVRCPGSAPRLHAPGCARGHDRLRSSDRTAPAGSRSRDATVDAQGDFLAKLQLTSGVYRARAASGHGFVAGNTRCFRSRHREDGASCGCRARAGAGGACRTAEGGLHARQTRSRRGSTTSGRITRSTRSAPISRTSIPCASRSSTPGSTAVIPEFARGSSRSAAGSAAAP